MGGSTNNGGGDWPPKDGVLTPEKMKAMMRMADALISDDVIAVSMLFPPDKVLELVDDRGRIWTMRPAKFRVLEQQADKLVANTPQLTSHFTHLLGVRFVFIDEGGALATRTCERIQRSLSAAIEVSDLLSRLRPAPTQEGRET